MAEAHNVGVSTSLQYLFDQKCLKNCNHRYQNGTSKKVVSPLLRISAVLQKALYNEKLLLNLHLGVYLA